MRGLIDCHVHTARCGHGSGSVADMVAAAERAGLAGIVLTEHLPLPDDLDPNRVYSMPPADLRDYVAEVRDASEASAIPVFLGIEADWLPGRLEHVTAMLDTAEWDVVLGSVHMLDGWAFDDPDLLDSWNSHDVDEVWETYFERLCDAAASGLFDVMAHPDLVKKFGHRPSFDPAELYDAAAKCFASGGVAAEVSTAGLRKPVGEMYPSPAFLSALVAHDVALTLGSDAHSPEEVGYALSDAAGTIRSAGGRVVSFARRKPREVES